MLENGYERRSTGTAVASIVLKLRRFLCIPSCQCHIR